MGRMRTISRGLAPFSGYSVVSGCRTMRYSRRQRNVCRLSNRVADPSTDCRPLCRVVNLVNSSPPPSTCRLTSGNYLMQVFGSSLAGLPALAHVRAARRSR
jgi:hypothetical protein